MQFKLIACLAALFTVAAAQLPCAVVFVGEACPDGYRVCGPLGLTQIRCCPITQVCL
ncbi:hypothetical protein B0H13DRAFT_2331753 [Mycena leptocephala]|nr:hypothetical protein B0H13DRAFT_2375198 [Mycena leptocephala]KAJ7851316.1 hypothetical protein B0H13DRAFT_2360208 [Mycena leptocephala]KAJ7908087.1 hypothetical protein B0H13DRAFT_2331753 [Mycena leptocephala]